MSTEGGGEKETEARPSGASQPGSQACLPPLVTGYPLRGTIGRRLKEAGEEVPGAALP